MFSLVIPKIYSKLLCCKKEQKCEKVGNEYIMHISVNLINQEQLSHQKCDVTLLWSPPPHPKNNELIFH